MPWLRYSDDEVLQFHPRFETAANEALRAEGLDTQYEWVHHARTLGNQLVPDFVLRHKDTSRWNLTVEIKRRPASVHSDRNQAQAKSYAELNADRYVPASPRFFGITNLEQTLLFALNGQAPPRECRLRNGLFQTGDLESLSEDDFMTNLVAVLRQVLSCVIGATSADFDLVWPQIQRQLINMADGVLGAAAIREPTTASWHLVRDYFCHDVSVDTARMFLLRCLLAEYARGVLARFGHPAAARLLSLKSARPAQAGEEIAKALARLRTVDFEALLGLESIEEYRRLRDPRVLQSLFIYVESITTSPGEIADLARTRMDREELLEGLLVSSHPGENLDEYGKVVTDPELAALLACLTIHDPEVAVCDPCCGSGALLQGAYDRLRSLGLGHAASLSRLSGAEADPVLAQLAIMRLILNEPSSVVPAIPIGVEHGDMFGLPAKIAAANVVLMNPPFKRYEAQSERPVPEPLKQYYASAIRSLGGRDPVSTSGQQNLYAYYVEFVIRGAAEGARIGVVLDNKWYHSMYAVPLRRLMLEQCAIEAIIEYPYLGLFADWTIATSLVILRKHAVVPPQHEVVFARCFVELSRVDANEVGNALAGRAEWPSGWRVKRVPQADLTPQDGWKRHFGSALEHEFLADLVPLPGLFEHSRRGSLRKEEGGVSSLDFPFSHKTYGSKRKAPTGRHPRRFETRKGALLSKSENETLHALAKAIPRTFRGFGVEHAENLDSFRITSSELLKEPILEPPSLRALGFVGGSRRAIWGPAHIRALKEIEGNPKTRSFIRAFRQITGLTKRLMPDAALFVSLREPTAGELIIPRKFRAGHKVHINPFAFEARGRQVRTSSNVRSFSNCIAIDDARGLDRPLATRLVAAFLISSFGQLQFEMLGYNREGCLCLELHQQDLLKVLDPRAIPVEARKRVLDALASIPCPIPSDRLSDELPSRNALDRVFAEVLCSMHADWDVNGLLAEVHAALDDYVQARRP